MASNSGRYMPEDAWALTISSSRTGSHPCTLYEILLTYTLETAAGVVRVPVVRDCVVKCVAFPVQAESFSRRHDS